MKWLARTLQRSLDLGRSDSFASLWAVFLMTLGIGTVIAFCAISWAVLFRPLPYPDSERLHRIVTVDESSGRVGSIWAKMAARIDAKARTIEEMTLFRRRLLTLQQSDGALRMWGAWVSENFFRTVGARPEIGSFSFTADELDSAGELAVLSHTLWQTRFGADPEVVGKIVEVNGAPAQVTAVARSDFHPEELTQGRLNTDWGAGSLDTEQLWLVRRFEDFVPTRPNVFQGTLPIIKRRAGVSPGQLEAELTAIAAGAPERVQPEEGTRIAAPALLESVADPVRPVLWILLTAGGLVLLMCCLNVASVLVHRWNVRAEELGIRRALGASIGRLAGGVVVESVTLAILAASGGLILALWVLSGVGAWAPPAIPRLSEIRPDGLLITAAFAIALATGLLSGLPAVIRIFSGRSVGSVVRSGGVGLRRGRGWTRPLLVGELALTLLILSGVGLLLATIRNLSDVDLGFDTRQIYISHVRLTDQVVGDDVAQRNRLFTELLESVADDPVHRFAVGPLPLGGGTRTTLHRAGFGEGIMTDVNPVSSGYFDVMGIRLEAGRLLDDTDQRNQTAVAVVSRPLADALWPGRNPIGQTFSLHDDLRDPLTVIGVVQGTHRRGIDRPAVAEAYLPFTIVRNLWSDQVLSRGGTLAQADSRIKSAAWAMDGTASVGGTTSLQALINEFFALRRFVAGVVTTFGVLALGISMLGIYAALAVLVRQRRRELAVRMALGAGRRRVAAIFLRYALLLVVPAVVAGNLGALGSGRVLESFLFGVQPGDPRLLLLASLLLVAAACIACLLPTWRASRLDPAALLREE